MYWQPIRCHTTPWFCLADDTLQVSFSELDVRRCHQHTLDVLWDMTSEVELYLTLWLFCSLLRNSLGGGLSLIKAELRNTFPWNELMEGYLRGTFLHAELASRISTWIFEVVIVLWPLKSQINALKALQTSMIWLIGCSGCLHRRGSFVYELVFLRGGSM
jgi:hypothetical protein